MKFCLVKTQGYDFSHSYYCGYKPLFHTTKLENFAELLPLNKQTTVSRGNFYLKVKKPTWAKIVYQVWKYFENDVEEIEESVSRN